MLRLTLAWIALTVCAATARAGMILDGVADSLYTSYATNFPPVGQVGNSSATLISSTWAITAAHVSNANLAQFKIQNQTYSVSQIVRHPQFLLNGANLNYGYDIALIRLATPVVGITPARIYTGTQEVGATVSLTGYGSTGVGSSNNPQNPGTFRAGTNIIDAISSFDDGPNGQLGAKNAAFVTDFDAPVALNPGGALNTLGDPLPTQLEYHLAGGDSGGGSFVLENGVWKLAGVNSGVASQFDWTQAGSKQLFGYGAISLMTRVSSYQTFIASVTGVPEPSSVALVLSVMAAVAIRVKRKLRINPPIRNNR